MGVTSSGGRFGDGVVFKIDSFSHEYSVVFNFETISGGRPIGQPALGRDGKLYGTTRRETIIDEDIYTEPGVLYSFDPILNVYKIEIDFRSTGFQSTNPLTLASNGRLYGAGIVGHSNSLNSIYSFDLNTGHFEIEYSSLTSNEGYVVSPLVLTRPGLFYGIGVGGNTDGVLFSFDTDTKAFDIKLEFVNENPALEGPVSLVYNHEDGRLYGSTERGAVYDNGGIFSFSIATGELKLLSSFPEDFNYPSHDFASDLHVDMERYLLGMDQYGMFRFNLLTNNFSYMGEVRSNLTTAPESFFVNDTGVVAINAGSSKYVLIKRLNAPMGLLPERNLFLGGSGLLYGATTAGGKNGLGGLFSFDPGSGELKMLKDYNQSIRNTRGQLVEMSDGNVYFLMEGGGVQGQGEGSLIRYNKSSGRFETLYAFDIFKDGRAVLDGLVKSPDGYLYGLTEPTPTQKFGGLFRFSIDTKKFEKVLSFITTTFSLTQGKDNKLYALTNSTALPSLNGIMMYDEILNTTEYYPYPRQWNRFGRGISVDSAGNLVVSFGYMFNTTEHSFSLLPDFSDSTDRNPTLPALVDSKGIIYTSSVARYDIDRDFKPELFQLLSLNEYSGKVTSLKQMERPLAFTPSVLYDKIEMPTLPYVTIQDTSAFESDGKAVIRIHLSKPLPYTLRLYYRTQKGTANAFRPNRDYHYSDGYIFVKAGTVDKEIRVSVYRDNLKEPDEYFYMQIIKARSVKQPVQVSDYRARVVIHDGDRPMAAAQNISLIGAKPADLLSKMQSADWRVKISPNPSAYSFRIELQSNRAASAEFMIVDVAGRVIQSRGILISGAPQIFGANWVPGVYFALVRQGKETQVLKLMKE